MFGTWVGIRYVWVFLLGLPYPMPLIGLFNFVAGFVTEVVVLFLQFPASWRRDGTFTRQLVFLMAAQLCLIVIFLAYFGWVAEILPSSNKILIHTFVFSLGWTFTIIPLDFQWTLGNSSLHLLS